MDLRENAAAIETSVSILVRGKTAVAPPGRLKNTRTFPMRKAARISCAAPHIGLYFEQKNLMAICNITVKIVVISLAHDSCTFGWFRSLRGWHFNVEIRFSFPNPGFISSYF